MALLKSLRNSVNFKKTLIKYPLCFGIRIITIITAHFLTLPRCLALC